MGRGWGCPVTGEAVLPGLRTGGLGETSIGGDVAQCPHAGSQTHMWQMLPGGFPWHGEGRWHPSLQGMLGSLPTTHTQKGQGEKDRVSLCPPSRGTETPCYHPNRAGVMQERCPCPWSTSRSHRKPWAWAGGLQGAGRSPQGSGEDARSQAAPRLFPLCPLPIEHPSATVQPLWPQRLHLLPTDGFGSAASPPLPPPPVCEIKVKKKLSPAPSCKGPPGPGEAGQEGSPRLGVPAQLGRTGISHVNQCTGPPRFLRCLQPSSPQSHEKEPPQPPKSCSWDGVSAASAIP